MAITNTRVQELNTIVFTAVGEQAVTTIVACNVSTVTTTLNLFAVPYGGNPGPTTQIINQLVLPGGETFALDSERFVLSSNDTFVAQAGAPDLITITISSVATS